MPNSPLAGKPPPASLLINVTKLREPYYSDRPDTSDPSQLVSFGTSGHRGSASRRSFNEAHIRAITQAICEYRAAQKTTGPLFIGMDSHALSEPAQRTALEVLAAHNIDVFVAPEGQFTPTPVISHAIIIYNRGRTTGLADGIVVTPSHNPPEDGGFKYNPTNGGPADTAATGWIEKRANDLLRANNADVKVVAYEKAVRASTTHIHDFVTPYVNDLGNIIDMDVARSVKMRIGADPLGGSNIAFWGPISTKYGLDITVVNPTIDPTFAFMPVDHDGKIRMDCSSPFAMANLVKLKDDYDIAFGNDTDSDRHGIVTRSAGLMNPNHYLAVAISYLFSQRTEWKRTTAVGKTLVSSSMIDRVSKGLGRSLSEVPVGFKWFVDGLVDGTLGFGGEESAGASFLRRDGSVWTTDKDGMIMDLLAVEILAKTGKDPSEHYQALTEKYGAPMYTRIDAPATSAQKSVLKKLTPDAVKAETLGGERITARLTKAPGNNADIGGLKVVTENGWFAARPSGTEDVYKIYAESFKGEKHLEQIVNEAKEIVSSVLGSAK